MKSYIISLKITEIVFAVIIILSGFILLNLYGSVYQKIDSNLEKETFNVKENNYYFIEYVYNSSNDFKIMLNGEFFIEHKSKSYFLDLVDAKFFQAQSNKLEVYINNKYVRVSVIDVEMFIVKKVISITMMMVVGIILIFFIIYHYSIMFVYKKVSKVNLVFVLLCKTVLILELKNMIIHIPRLFFEYFKYDYTLYYKILNYIDSYIVIAFMMFLVNRYIIQIFSMDEFKIDKVISYSMLSFLLIPNDIVRIIIIMMFGRYSTVILFDKFVTSIKRRKKLNVYLASLIFVVGGLFNFIQIVITKNKSNYIFLSSLILFMFLISWSIIEKYRDESLLDALTEVYNKRYLLNFGEKFFDNYKNKIMSILIIDLDDFKKINDLYGHNNGDMILKSIVNLIVGIIRKSDVISRFGGEEFVIIMPNTKLEDAKVIAERIRIEIEQNNFNDLRCTVSIGLENNIGKNSFNEMFESADKKLYEAKKSGKNCVIG